MNHPENDKWLDDALAETIGSKKTESNFEKWKQEHPEAVEMLTSRARSKASTIKRPHSIRIMIMKSPITKLAAAAVIIIAVLIGINQFGGSIDGASVAWADVAERFESVPFFNVTIYLGWGPYEQGGPYEQDQKLVFYKIEQWKSENGQTRTHSGNEVIFAEFVDGNNVVVAFDSSTKQPLNADRMAKLANSFHGFLRPKKGEFSLDTLLMGFPSDDKGITPVETADTPASKETVLFEVKHKTTPTQVLIWALRKSKLPVRASLSDPKNKVYTDMLFNYSERKDAKFFDPNAFTSQQTDVEDRQ